MTTETMSTPRIGISLHESPELGTVDLDELDTSVNVPFPETSPGHTRRGSISAPDLHESQISNQQSLDTQASTSTHLTSSDKLTALPVYSATTPNLGRVRLPSTSGNNFRQSNSGYTSQPVRPAGSTHSSPGKRLNPLSHDTLPRSNHVSSDPSTPQRHSIEGERPSLSSSVKNAFRMHRGSDPPLPSTAQRPSAADPGPSARNSPGKKQGGNASRGSSPYRFIPQFSFPRHQHQRKEDLFVPTNPFEVKTHFSITSWIPCHSRFQKSDIEEGSYTQDCDELIFPRTARAQIAAWLRSALTLFADTLPRIIYLHLLFRLPALYFSRVSRVFQDAEVSRPDIERMIDACADSPSGNEYFENYGASLARFPSNNETVGRPQPPRQSTVSAPSGPQPFSTGNTPLLGGTATMPFSEDFSPPIVSQALVRFKRSWETFIESLTREWKTLNLVSALLLSAILTIFQIGKAEQDPVTRSVAFLSLICALMSLSYGCVYIVRFGSMRSMVRASRWAEEARQDNTAIFWNVWVLLAMPAIWLSWSMIFFITAILTFVWRTGASNDPDDGAAPQLSPKEALGPRIAVTAVTVLGLVYFILIIWTLQRYGHGPVARPSETAVNQLRNTPALGTRSPARQSEAALRGRPWQRGSSARIPQRPEIPAEMAVREETEQEKKELVGLGLDILGTNTPQRTARETSAPTVRASTNTD